MAVATVPAPQAPALPALPALPARALRGQVGRFAVIGAGSTVLNLGLLAILAGPLGSQTANLVSLVVSTLANTTANRWWTFQVRGTDGLARHQAQGLLVFALTWATTSGAIALLGVFWPHGPTWATVAAVATANAASTVVRFAAMRSWMFR